MQGFAASKPSPGRKVCAHDLARRYGFRPAGRVTFWTARKSPKNRRGTRPVDYGSANAPPRSIGPLTPGPPITGDAYLLDFAELPARKI